MRSERALAVLLALAALLLAALPARAALPGSNGDVVFAHGFDWPTRHVGGVNYHWHALGPGCGIDAREPFGLLPNYHVPGVRAQALAQLATMHARGMRTLVLGVFFYDGPPTGTLIDARNEAEIDQVAANLDVLLADAAAAGWERVFFRFFPQGAMNPQGGGATAFDAGTLWMYQRMIAKLRAPLVAGPLEYLIDLGVELAPRDKNSGSCALTKPTWKCPANAAWSNAVRDLWQFYVAAFDTSADTVGFSFLPNYESMRSRVRHMRYVYGDDYPSVLAVDPYGDLQHHEGEQFIEFVRAVDEFLVPRGWTEGEFIIAESWHNDPLAAERFSSAIAATRARVAYFTAWPLDRGATCPDVSVPPPLEFDMYRMFGF